MSVITYRDGTMAADSRAYSGSHRPIGRKTKIHRTSTGALVGVATSTPGLGEWLIEWYANDAEELAPLPGGIREPSFSLLAVTPDGLAYHAEDTLVLAGPLTADFFAVGTGGSYALGAMAHGAGAVEAALIAAELDPLCGPPVASLTHKSGAVKWHSS